MSVVPDIIAVDFFVVATVSPHLLYCFTMLRHDRRRLAHFNVTAHPTARWIAQQIVEVLPFDEAPRFLIRDHAAIHGQDLRERIKHLDIEEVVIAHRSPRQHPHIERLIYSVRRECLDRVAERGGIGAYLAELGDPADVRARIRALLLDSR